MFTIVIDWIFNLLVNIFNIIKSTESIVMDSLKGENAENIEKLEVANG